MNVPRYNKVRSSYAAVYWLKTKLEGFFRTNVMLALIGTFFVATRKRVL